MSFSCTDKDTLIAYVYGECDAATHGVVEAHVRTCAACSDEIGGFGMVRETLSEWTPPEQVGVFKLVREEALEPPPAKVLRPARWWQAPLPALAKVAAAILLFAGGAALANLEVRYDKDGFAVRTGWQKSAPAGAPLAVTQAPAGPQAEIPAGVVMPAPSERRPEGETPWRAEFASLERQLRDEFRQQLAAARPTPLGGGPVQVAAGFDENLFLSRVRTLLDERVGESERRQQVEMAYRISQLAGDFQAQRKADLVRVQQTFGQLDGPPPSLDQQRQMTRYLFPVSLRK